MNAHSRSLQSALLRQKLLYLLSSEEKALIANKVTTSQIMCIHFANMVNGDMVNQTALRKETPSPPNCCLHQWAISRFTVHHLVD